MKIICDCGSEVLRCDVGLPGVQPDGSTLKRSIGIWVTPPREATGPTAPIVIGDAPVHPNAKGTFFHMACGCGRELIVVENPFAEKRAA